MPDLLAQLTEVLRAWTRGDESALRKVLAAFDPRKARVVELRYFGGLTSQEAAAVLCVSPQTINRDWGLAKAWLIELRRKEYDGRPPLGND